MTFTLPELPYAKDALAPYLSGETLEYHHDKHHNAYVTKLNELIEGTEMSGKSLEDIIATSDGPLFNNAAQVWNHTFFWNCMKPGGGGTPSGSVGKAIDQAFGTFADFRREFAQSAVTQFGSGWAWLVLDSGTLKVVKTGNADLPLKHKQTALLTVDVWEHAYYIDYRNARPTYVETFIDHLINWDFVAANLNAAR